jgi:general secretion pathway protein D
MNALASDAGTNILSTPSLVTLDNEEAEIIIGENVPFITGSFTSAADDATNPFQTIQREDVGLTSTRAMPSR